MQLTPYLRQYSISRWRSRIGMLLLTLTLSLANWLPILAASQIDIVGPIGSGRFGTSITLLTNGNFVVTDPEYDLPNGTTDVGAVYLYNGISGALMSTLTGSTKDDQVGKDGVVALSNGNFVVVSPRWDHGLATDAGAVTWMSGTSQVNGVVSSSNSFVGSSNGGRVGSGGVIALSNGNYVVVSPYWDNFIIDAGAVTWGDGSKGVSGVVNSSNSLVGNASGDWVGMGGVTALSNGNYVVVSPNWDNSIATDAGAVTWGNGATGISGVINSNNSLVGTSSGDQVGYGGVTMLSNGNYVVNSYRWGNGNAINVGAVTWGNGTTGVSGVVSSSNSLVGSTVSDIVGHGGVTALSNGNYVVVSSGWNNGSVFNAGAVTWGNGTTGVSGVVNSSNSLVGSTDSDSVGVTGTGWDGVIALSNGNYVVRSPLWDSGNVTDVGAVTWGNGATSTTTGVVNSSNSLVGSTNSDNVGDYVDIYGVTALSNGNYVVVSPRWDNGNFADAGAVTWGNGSSGVSGVINHSNSLVGSTNDDRVGSDGVMALSNGHYVVDSSQWDSGLATNAGAVTWGNGATGSTTGVINHSNSLVGSTVSDFVGYGGMTALSNGNYVVHSHLWDNSNVADTGAVTWGNGATGVSGPLTSSNSVMGKAANSGFSMNFTFDATNQQLIVGRPADNLVTLVRFAPAAITVTGKAVAIVNGALTPKSNDGTELGAIVVGSGARTQDFSIHNEGELALTVNAITLSGAQAGDFSLSGFTLPQVVAPNTSINFTLNFTPGAVGLHSATVNIVSDDANETPYTFAVQGSGTQHKLTTNKIGNGSGSLTLSPAGGSYNHNTVVTVTAKADAGSTFAGWSGDCSGSGNCVVTMNGAKSITASFKKEADSGSKVYLPVVLK